MFGGDEVEVVAYILILLYWFAMGVPTTSSIYHQIKKVIYYCPPPSLFPATSR